MLLAPEADEAGGDVADPRVSVIVLAEFGYKVFDQGLDPGVVVVGGEAVSIVVVEIVFS